MINRRLLFFRPPATHAEGHLEVTTIVVVVIDIYLYDYYYLNGHSDMIDGPLLSGPAPSCATMVLMFREEVLADWHAEMAESIRPRGPHQLRRLR